MDRIKLFFGIIVFSVLVARAQNSFVSVRDTTALKQKIEKMSANLNTLESDFIQIKQMSLLKDKVESKGHFMYARKDNLRWEYTKPYYYLIVLSKNKMVIKDDQKARKYDVNSNKVFKELNELLLASVNGNIFSSRKFQISYFENEKYYRLDLIPNSVTLKQGMKKMLMYFDKPVTRVERIELVEEGNDRTEIYFSNQIINQSIPIEKFQLK